MADKIGMVRLSFWHVISSLFLSCFISSTALAQDPVGFAILNGTQTTAAGDPTDLNQTAAPMEWSSSSFDSTYFSHSTSSFSHEVTISTFGDYKLSLTAPLILQDTSGNRRQVIAEVYVNGAAVSHGRAASSYIRQASGHAESSLHTSILLESLQVNDKVTVYFSQGAAAGRVTTEGTQMVLEYIPSSRSIFTGRATRTVANTNVNQAGKSALQWTESIKDVDYSHSNSTNSENITLTAGDYMVYVNMPIAASGGCAGRMNPRLTIELGGAVVTGGSGAQGYIRCQENHDSASLHWVGLLDGVTGGQILTISSQAETTRTDNVIVPAGREASVYIEKVNASSEFISLRGVQLLTGTNWNASPEAEIQWNTQAVIDGATFTHSTVTNSQIITVDVDGDYFVTYNDHMTSTSARSNPMVRIKVNGSIYQSAICKSHYIRNSEGHRESSCTLTQYLQGLSSGDQISVELLAESSGGTVNDQSPARLTVQRVGPASSSGTCTNIIDCTPDRILHYDGQQLQSILDNSSRTANDVSFAGDVAEWLDVSGSTTDHDGTQATAGSRPGFNSVTQALTFDGTADHLDIANHADLNTGTLKEKSIVVVFRTGSDVTTPQVIYEEGGTVRGMNVYIRAGNLYIAFWNIANDGDGSQAFTSASTPVVADTFYYASLVIDYSNYTGPAGPDGQLRGHINGVAFPALGTTTSLLYPHPGAIALGSMSNDTYFDTGPQSGGTGHFFLGEINEFIIYNHAISNTDAVSFYNFLSNKWPDPQPVTNLALASQYTTLNTTSPNVTWTASVSSDVTHYETAVGTTAGATDVQNWTNQGNVTSVAISGLSLAQCTDYYASVKAVDGGADESTVETTDFFRFDGVNPTDPSGLVVSGTSSTTQSKTLSWTSSTDDCAFARYEISIGTAAGLTDVVGWTDVGNVLTHTFTSIAPPLVAATNYFFNIRAHDEAGNTSSVVSSSAWQVDTCVSTDVTNPTDPSAFAITGNAGPTTSPSHTWTASTDSCGLSHYEMAIGTSAGASDVVAFTNIGDVSTHKFFSISPSLATNTNYFTSIRAHDLAGNTSAVVSTSAWQLPTPGGVSSGLVLWLDADDAGTLYTDNTCSTPATVDGDFIGCWQDKSTSTNNATTTGGTRPTLQLNEFNNQSILRFDGTNDVLDFASNINTIRTVFVVNKSTATTFQPLLGHTTSQNFFTNNDTLLDATISSSNLRSGTWRVDQANVTAPTIFSQTGSYSLISVVTSGNVEADHIASDQKTGGRFFAGDVVEVIVYDRALNSTEVSDVETYLYNKWFTAIPPAVTGLAFDSTYSQSSSQSPSFSWTHSTAPDLDHYEVALGTSAGANDISGWTSIGLPSTYQFLGQTLTECQGIYASVRAVDTDSYISSFASSMVGFFDGTAPSLPSSLVISGTATTSQSKLLSWSPGTDSCSTVTHEVALGTTANGNDIVDWTAVTGNSHQFTSIAPPLVAATNYFMSVRALDEAGNVTSSVSSAAWQLDSCVSTDVTNPTDPSSLTLSGSGSVIKSQQLSWAASTDACSLSHYEVALGTTATGTEVVTWTNVGNVLNYEFSNLSLGLAFSTNYFLSVRAVDSAGNNSNAVSSAAWQLTSPGGVSPTGLQLWVDVNDSLTLYQDSGCSATPVAVNNDTVSCARDKSGNNNHASNSSSLNSPNYNTTGFNGSPTLYFDGSIDEYLTFNSTISTIRTVFWVLKEDTSSPGNTSFLLGDSAGATFDFHRGSTTGPIFSGAQASANVTGGTLQLNASAINGTTTNMPSSEAVLSLVTTGNVTANSFSQDRTSCCASRTWGGQLSELIIFDRALSGAEITNVENYLMLKWGVSATATQWLGTTNTDWFTPTNWSAGVPDATRTCIIPDQANDPIINGTAICNDVEITTGTVTFQNSTSSILQAYGNFNNTGTVNWNDGTLVMQDDGVSNTDQSISSTTAIGNLNFDKTAGGSVSIDGSSLQVDSLTLPGGSLFSFNVPNGSTLNLTTGMSMAAGTFDVDGGGTVNVSDGQSIAVSGGTFQITGTNDVYPQTTTNKGTITSAGRWGFNATGGNISLTGFILNRMNVSGLQVQGTANLTAFDGGQFTNLLNDFATPVRALVLNTTTSISETLASNIGFSWSSANATYSAIATPSDNYFLVHANNCNSSVLVFDQWFGDFWGVAPQPDLESKIFDTDDGGTCQVTMDIAASPVHLVALSASPYDQAVSIDWETGSETNHLGFNVYRSDSYYGNYQQINQEVIQNFVNTTSFRGSYRYVDSGLTNGELYYYMIEDIALNGERKLHGPVYASPQAVLGAPPAHNSEDNSIEDGIAPGPVTITSDDSQVLAETQSGLRVRITPSALTVSEASWNSSYKNLEIPGYGHTLKEGEPELLYRRFLIEVEKNYSSMSETLRVQNFVSATADLSGSSVSPAPSWNLNVSTQKLEASYSVDATTYALNQWLPGQTYSVNPQTLSINGKNFIQIDVWPVRYNPSSNQMEKLSNLTIDIALNGSSAWDPNTPENDVTPEPAAIENNLRIRYSSSGMYQLSYDDLVTQSLEGPFESSNVNELRLYHRGKEIPLEVQSADAVFNSGDILRFYTEYIETLESDKDEVILSLLDLRKEKDIDPDFDNVLRILEANNSTHHSPLSPGEYRLKTVSQEQNLYSVFDTPIGGAVDHIYWKRIFTQGGSAPDANSVHTVNFILDDIHLQNDKPVKVKVELRGRGIYALNPDHHIALDLNTQRVGDLSFTGTEPKELVFEVPSYAFASGANQLDFTSLASYVNSGDYDLIDINKVSIEYYAAYRATESVMPISDRQQGEQIAIEGFTHSNLKVYDITNPVEAMIYQNISVTPYNGAQLLQFDSYVGEVGLSGKDFYIVENDQYFTPDSMGLTFGAEQFIKKAGQGADYIIVGPASLIDAVETLRVHRESQGLQTRSLSIEQIYDEFSHGRKSSQALRDFAAYVKENWVPAPRYLLLVGDSTYDAKGQLNAYGAEQMPMPLEKGASMDYGSDNFFVEKENILPQMAIGRLPANNEEDLARYAAKVIDYENNSMSEEKAKTVSFVSGQDLHNEHYDDDINELSHTLQTLNPQTSTTKLSLSDYATSTEVQQAVSEKFDQGSSLMIYYGHGAEGIWGSTSAKFTTSDASNLSNSTLPIVVGLNCLNSHFYDIDKTFISLGESFIFNDQGGSVAFWGSTSQTAPIAQRNLAQSFVTEFANKTAQNKKEARLGDLIQQAKIQQGDHGHSQEVVRSWTLLGDPALLLPETAFSSQPQSDVQVTPTPAAGGGGGCSAFAGRGKTHSPFAWLELIFLLLPLLLNFYCQRRIKLRK